MTRYLRIVLVSALAALALAYGIDAAHAATVARINDAKLTDEHAQCPRLYREAVRFDGVRGCWTIGEHSRGVTIFWADGRIDRYTEMQFEIYGRIER